MRALHYLADPDPKVFADPIAPRIVDLEVVASVRDDTELFTEPLRRELRLHVLLRSRYAEEELEAAVARGVRQFVCLGAGFDTFAYRQPLWAQGIRIYEVDHTATQAEKRRCLEAAGIEIPANVTYVPVDFERSTLRDELARAGFHDSQSAFFSWLGVIAYLTEGAIDATFAFVASLPKGSEIAFDFASKDSPAPIALAAHRAGETWLTRYESASLEQTLRATGFTEVTFLTPPVARARFALDEYPHFAAPTQTSIGKARR
jgi:methyltransferase (TIGR00027 family)